MIRTTNLTKRFGDNVVLDAVDLEIQDGETFFLIGHSGSGKSVLMKHLVGLLYPDAGRIEVDGTDLTRASDDELRSLRERFGMLFQNGALFDFMSVYENIAFPLRMFTDLEEEEIRDRVADCLRQVSLEGAAEKTTAELSGGMRKRVALARAIVREPSYLFYDEPYSGLDPETSGTINDLIQHLADELGATSLVVTHNMYAVLTTADRFGFLYDGTLRFIGTPEEARNSSDSALCSFLEAHAYEV